MRPDIVADTNAKRGLVPRGMSNVIAVPALQGPTCLALGRNAAQALVNCLPFEGTSKRPGTLSRRFCLPF